MDDPVFETILTRASQREGFDERPIDDAVLEAIIACGLAAPSSKNAQPWRFHVVRSTETLSRVATAVDRSDVNEIEDYVPHDPRTGKAWPEYSTSVRESAQTLQDCSAAVFIENRGVFSRGREVLADAPGWNMIGQLVGYGFEMIGIGAAVENMLLAAHRLGLYAVFMGDVLIAEDEIRTTLQMEGDLQGVIALGHGPTRPPRPFQGDVREDPLHVVWHR